MDLVLITLFINEIHLPSCISNTDIISIEEPLLALESVNIKSSTCNERSVDLDENTLARILLYSGAKRFVCNT